MKDSYDVSPPMPKLCREFIARRLMSFAGFFFLLFLCEHLFTNSQATLFLGDDGKGFIDAVNWIHSLPYLQVIELTLIGLPIGVHVWWGIERIRMAKLNSVPSQGEKSYLPYKRNIAFSWQRITAILLIVLVGLHVLYMRFLKEPHSVQYGVSSEHFVKLDVDSGLYSLAPRLNIMLFDAAMIKKAEEALKNQKLPREQPSPFEHSFYNPELAKTVKAEEHLELEKRIIAEMGALKPSSNQVVAICDSFGTASLMMLRDTFKSVFMCLVYSLFVVIAAFHGCNGLWTFAITWGVSLSERSRRIVRVLSNVLMALLIFFGLASIWGVYWINLRY